MTEAVATRYAGTRVPRVEDTRLLTGHGTFVDDVSRPGMLHACFVRSPFARARINGIDTSAALALPGVHAVFVADDLNPRRKEAWHAVAGKDIADTPRPPLAEGEVKFVGDPVALVVAESALRRRGRRRAGRRRLRTAARRRRLHQGRGGSAAESPSSTTPIPTTSRAEWAERRPTRRPSPSAAHVASAHVYQQIHAPVPIETRGLVAEWEASSRELTMWASTQTPHELRAFAARLLGIPAQNVRVIMRDTGGGFGQKVVPMREDMCIMLAARKVSGALKWIEDRRENLMSAGQARHVDGDVRMAFDEDGNILAADIDFVQDIGAYPTPYPVLTTAAIGMFFPGPYRVPKASFNYKTVFSNTAGLAAYRGPWQYETLTREILLDIAARKMDMDPVELRRRNILRGDEMPYFNPNGMPYDHVAPADTFEQAVKILDHEGFRKEQTDALGAGPLHRAGVLGLHRADRRRDRPPRHRGRDDPDGADRQDQRLRQRRIDRQQHRDDGRPADRRRAGRRHRRRLDDPGRHRRDAVRRGHPGQPQRTDDRGRRQRGGHDPAQADRRDGRPSAGGRRVRHRAGGLAGQSSATIPRRASASPTSPTARTTSRRSCRRGWRPTLEATARFTSQTMIHWANATHACTCEVDIETGHVTLTRYIVSEDVGPMINPNVVEGQIAGGTVQGIGGALLENMVYDDDGNPLVVDVRRLPAADRHRGARRSNTATSRSPGPASADTRAAAKAVPSGRHPRSSTPSTTRWPRSV